MRDRRHILMWCGALVATCALIDVYRVAGVPAAVRWFLSTDGERFRGEHGFAPPPSARGFVFRTRGVGKSREACAGFEFAWEESEHLKLALGEVSGDGILRAMDPRLDVKSLLGRGLWRPESPPEFVGCWEVQWDPIQPLRVPAPILTIYRAGRVGFAVVRSHGEPPP